MVAKREDQSSALDKDTLIRWLVDAERKRQEWLNRADTDRAYFEGEQWDPQTRRELEEAGQPVITVNHLWSKVNNLVGLLLQQQPTVKCLPRGKHDAELSSMATSVIRYVMDINQVDASLTEVFTDTLTTGAGWLEVAITNELNRDPIIVEYVPYDEIIFDPLARQPDLSDARFVARLKMVEADIVSRKYPQAKKQIDALRLGEGLTGSVIMGMEFPWELYNRDRDLVAVVEIQYKTYAEKECIWDGVQAEVFRPELHSQLVEFGLYEVRKMSIPVIRRALFVGGELVYDEELPYMFGSFTFVPFVAYRDRNGLPLSLVSIVRDVQDEINKRRSKVLHYLQARRVLAEEGAIPNPKEFLEEMRRPDALLRYRRGFNVTIENDLELSAQHFTLMQEAINELSLISGIYPDFVGAPTNARTGVALRTRILQSQNSVQRYFSALQRGLKGVAERILALAKQYYSGERILQILDASPEFGFGLEMREGELEPRNTLASLRADIVVTISAGGMTERQEQLASLVEVLKVLPPNLLVMSLDVILDAFDIPQKEKLKERYQLMLMQMINASQQQSNEEGGV